MPKPTEQELTEIARAIAPDDLVHDARAFLESYLVALQHQKARRGPALATPLIDERIAELRAWLDIVRRREELAQ